MRLFEFNDIDRDTKNVLPIDLPLAYEAWDLADEVEGEFMERYKEANNIDEFHNMGDYAKTMVKIRNKIGTKVQVPINKIFSSEKELHSSHLGALKNKNTKSSSELPVLYKINNKFTISDGNHRVAYAQQVGKKDITALVIDLDSLSKELDI